MPRLASRDKVDSAPGSATLTVAATANRLFRSGAASTEIAFGLWLAQQLRQLCDIHCDLRHRPATVLNRWSAVAEHLLCPRQRVEIAAIKEPGLGVGKELRDRLAGLPER
jgi:hypothetical protein